jgi:hypothetical protein
MRSLIVGAALLASVAVTMGFSARSYEYPSPSPDEYTSPEDTTGSIPGSPSRQDTVNRPVGQPSNQYFEYRPCPANVALPNGHHECLG